MIQNKAEIYQKLEQEIGKYENMDATDPREVKDMADAIFADFSAKETDDEIIADLANFKNDPEMDGVKIKLTGKDGAEALLKHYHKETTTDRELVKNIDLIRANIVYKALYDSINLDPNQRMNPTMSDEIETISAAALEKVKEANEKKESRKLVKTISKRPHKEAKSEKEIKEWLGQE